MSGGESGHLGQGPVLVTGAAGLLGANAALSLQDRGIRVTAAYRRPAPRVEEVPAVFGDLTDPAVAVEMLRQVQPRWVLHCAALTNVDHCEDHPEEARRINADAAGTLARACVGAGARMVYISTDSVFDGREGGYVETDECAPANEYARSKLLGEEAVLSASPAHLVLRTNIYGWNLQPKLSLAEWMLGRLEAGEEFNGFSDVHFNPLLVNDLVDLTATAMERGLRGVYHAGSADPVSKLDFARILARVFEHDASRIRPAELKDAALRAPRPLNTTLQTDRFARAIGRPMPDNGEGLARFRRLFESGFVRRLRVQPQGATDAVV